VKRDETRGLPLNVAPPARLRIVAQVRDDDENIVVADVRVHGRTVVRVVLDPVAARVRAEEDYHLGVDAGLGTEELGDFFDIVAPALG
jgi:hypothetical protein